MTQFLHAYKINVDVLSSMQDASDVTPDQLRAAIMAAVDEAIENGNLENIMEGPFSSDVLRSHFDNDETEEPKYLPGFIFESAVDRAVYRFETSEDRVKSLIETLQLVQDAEDGVARQYYFAMIAPGEVIQGERELVASWDGIDWVHLDPWVEDRWNEMSDDEASS